LIHPHLDPRDMAAATGDYAAIGASTPEADDQPSPSWGLLAVMFALWVGTLVLFVGSIRL
jgi:hypothetical protein